MRVQEAGGSWCGTACGERDGRPAAGRQSTCTPSAGCASESSSPDTAPICHGTAAQHGTSPSSHGTAREHGSAPQHGTAREHDAAPQHGTAPTATAGWLLIEHPGPWPAFGYPPDLAPELAAAADRLLARGVRPQLIRRTDRAGRSERGSPAVFLAGGSGQERWIERVEPDLLTDPHSFGLVDQLPFAAPRPPGLGRATGPQLLVCTHGRREVCCARFGRPVAVALAARFGPLVWETTHVGGDRFAANLVLLPEGLYFGQLDPARAVQVAERALAGELELEAYRGTAGESAAGQSAEWHLRRALAERRVRALRRLAVRPEDGAGPGLPAAFRFQHTVPGGRRYAVTVRPGSGPEDYRLVSITGDLRSG